ncbi:MAG: 23S rRNA (adenine(2503)-C(2))-methyltransferase RlmN [Candidatus Absconditabacteria bacterium]
MIKKSILNDIELEEFRKEFKIQPYRLKQIVYEIYNNCKISFDEMTTLSKEFRLQLNERFDIIPFKLDKIIESGDTTKFSFLTSDGHIIESVLMFHTHDKGDHIKLNRITQCLSTQIGCPIGCKFCVTGMMGITRNLNTNEIIGQILFANNYVANKFGKKLDGTLRKVRNVVFMGMGEPLLNYDNLMSSIQIMLEQTKLSLSRRHITISTVGIIPGIKKLIEDKSQVRLAISLHSADQNIRENLIPVAKKYTLSELKDVLGDYLAKTGIRLFYEYIMIDSVTDSIQQANQLVKFIGNHDVHVNLIAYNENPASDYKESSKDNIDNFKEVLIKNNILVTVRGSLGRESKGACGQLGYDFLHEYNTDCNN